MMSDGLRLIVVVAVAAVGIRRAGCTVLKYKPLAITFPATLHISSGRVARAVDVLTAHPRVVQIVGRVSVACRRLASVPPLRRS